MFEFLGFCIFLAFCVWLGFFLLQLMLGVGFGVFAVIFAGVQALLFKNNGSR